jgi:hypothetical protein
MRGRYSGGAPIVVISVALRADSITVIGSACTAGGGGAKP